MITAKLLLRRRSRWQLLCTGLVGCNCYLRQLAHCWALTTHSLLLLLLWQLLGALLLVLIWLLVRWVLLMLL